MEGLAASVGLSPAGTAWELRIEGLADATRTGVAHREDGRIQTGCKEDHMTGLARLMELWRRDEGQDLLEYALLVALIALVAVGAVTAAGVSVNNIFTQIAGAI